MLLSHDPFILEVAAAAAAAALLAINYLATASGDLLDHLSSRGLERHGYIGVKCIVTDGRITERIHRWILVSSIVVGFSTLKRL